MPREIKFRVWDKLEKRFDLNYHLTMDLNGCVHNLQNGAGGEDYEIQQFTGLLDKNGKEIWEGDVIEEKWADKSKHLSTVKFGFHEAPCSQLIGVGWFHEPINESWRESNVFTEKTKHLKVIGNIYQNPELLK